MKKPLLWLPVIMATIGAAVLRLPSLERRPMHCDEAVHADKIGTLLEGGGYRYNPTEYHGPTLNYFTLIPARLRGFKRYVELDEATLRIVPALFGIALVPLLFLWKEGLGLRAVSVAALLLTFSPVMTYYSRYYIQEMLLLFFTCGWLAGGYRFLCKPTPGWLVFTGVFLGFSHATKETFVLALGSAFAALGVCRWIGRRRSANLAGFPVDLRWSTSAIIAVSALTTSFFFHSSFFTYYRGVADSFLTFFDYMGRIRNAEQHLHPWYYYLQTILFFKEPGGPLWTEGMIFLFGCIGLIVAVRRKHLPGTDPRLLPFLAAYTVILTVTYSLISYKTPWCLVQFWLGWILLAGVGVSWLIEIVSLKSILKPLLVLPILGMIHLGWQAWRASFPMDADPRNPFVYAHTGHDVFEIVNRIAAVSAAHPDGNRVPIQIYSKENLWPLPWYLRRFPQVRWWKGVSEKAANAPVILATADMESAVVHKLYEIPPPGERELYMRMFDRYVELRPQVEMRGYVARSLWDDYLRHTADSNLTARP